MQRELLEQNIEPRFELESLEFRKEIKILYSRFH
jgi:hypothetical protein